MAKTQEVNKTQLEAAFQNAQAESANKKAIAQTQEPEVQEAPKANYPTLIKDDRYQGPWYHNTEREDLVDVTDEDHNPKLGMKQINIYPPRDEDIQYDIVASVSVEFDNGIKLFDIGIRFDPDTGRIRLRFPFSKRSGQDGARDNYFNSVSLTDAMNAQLLRFAHKSLNWGDAE